MGRIFKWSWIPLLIILIALCVYIVVGNWEVISTYMVLDKGGWMYDDNGEIIGMWDGWSTKEVPKLFIPFSIIKSVFFTSILSYLILINSLKR